MALGSTKFATEISTRNQPEGKERPTRKADNFTAIWEPIVHKIWDPRRLTTFKACYRDSNNFLESFKLYHRVALRKLVVTEEYIASIFSVG
jgi:hypothetical protein